jgi:hypothetical protein
MPKITMMILFYFFVIILSCTKNVEIEKQVTTNFGVDKINNNKELNNDIENLIQKKENSITEKIEYDFINYEWANAEINYNRVYWGTSINEFISSYFIFEYPDSTDYENIKVYVFKPDMGIMIKNYFFDDKLFEYIVVDSSYDNSSDYNIKKTIEYIKRKHGIFDIIEESTNGENELVYKFIKNRLIIKYTINRDKTISYITYSEPSLLETVKEVYHDYD